MTAAFTAFPIPTTGISNALVTSTGSNTARSLASRFTNPFNVKDFGAAGNGVADDTAAIQSAISACVSANGGTVFLPSGTYIVSSTLAVNASNVYLQGGGPGSHTANNEAAPATLISWAGGSSPMIVFGANGIGSTCTGAGGISQLALDGKSLASHCLRVIDANFARFSQLAMQGATAANLHLTGTFGFADPTDFIDFVDLSIDAWRNGPGTADGILIGGTPSSAVGGPTLCAFRNITIQHQTGHGVHWQLGGDGMQWTKVYTFAPSGSAGYGLYAGGDGTAVTGTNQFNYAFINNGVFCNSTTAVGGWYFAAIFDSADVNSARTGLFFGPGAASLYAYGANTNSYYGIAQNSSTNPGIGVQYLAASGQAVAYTPGQATINWPTASNRRLAVVGANGEQVIGTFFSVANFGSLEFTRYNGTIASPSALTNGQGMGQISFGGWNGSGLTGLVAGIQGIATGTWSAGVNTGAGMFFLTTPTNTTSNQLSAVLAASGGFFVGTGFGDPGTGNIQANGFVQTGAVQVGSLPSASSCEGARMMVSNSNVAASTNFGAIVAAGGSNIVPVYSDGTNWRIG